MAIPTNDDMDKFQKELESMGPDEVQRNRNQLKWGEDPKAWKLKEVERFLSKKSREREDDYKKILMNYEKQKTTISWIALGISLLSLLISMFK